MEEQKKCKDRLNIYIDGEYAFSCSIDAVVKNKLNLGKSINTRELKSIIEDDNYEKGKSCALRILERGSKSEKEMISKLKEKGFDDPTCERVISMLKEYGYIDDEKLADAYINQKVKTEGSKKIKEFLYKKGIPEEIIKEKISYIDEKIEETAAFNLALKKYSILRKTESDKRKLYGKLGGFLVRKGYSYEISRRVMNIILADSDDISDDSTGGEY